MEANGVNLGVLVLGFEGLMGREKGVELGFEVKIEALTFRGGRFIEAGRRRVWLSIMFGKLPFS